jgi:hypothetical protein
MPTKVFQIGFNKCGTRTISRFLQQNGFKAIHWDGGNLALAIYRNLTNGESLIKGYEQFDVFTDMETIRNEFAFEAYKLFPSLADEFPEALFILNTRDREDWIRSRFNHGNGIYARRWKSALGITDDARLEEIWRDDWERHHERVCDFFSRRTAPFVKFDIAKDSPELIARQFPDRAFDLTKYGVKGKTQAKVAARPATTGARTAAADTPRKRTLSVVDL